MLHNPSSMFYVSGYTGEGMVFVSGAQCAVITDFRYTEQAENQTDGFSIEMIQGGKSHEDVVNALCKAHQMNTVYYEHDYLTVKGFDACQKKVEDVAWKPVYGALEDLREIKDDAEIALMAQACKITSEAFERVIPTIKEGMTEKDIALALEFDMFAHGAQSTSFSTIVAAGANGSLPHAVPSNYQIKRGDMITMDFGARYGQYCADMTRTIAFGTPSDEMKKVYQTVRTAQKMAQDAVMAGKRCCDIDAIARDYIDNQGYKGRFGHGLGHSVGIDIHENPRLSTACDKVLKVGHVVTVEPGIYLPGVGGVRIENSVVVTQTGCAALTTPTCDLIVL